MRSKKIITTTALIILFVIVVLAILYAVNDAYTKKTKYFFGVVEQIVKNDDNTVTFVIKEAYYTSNITADKRTKYITYDNKKADINDINVGEYISGQCRLFNNDFAKYIEVTNTAK